MPFYGPFFQVHLGEPVLSQRRDLLDYYILLVLTENSSFCITDETTVTTNKYNIIGQKHEGCVHLLHVFCQFIWVRKHNSNSTDT